MTTWNDATALIVIDATFSRRQQRERDRDLAREFGVPALCFETRCEPGVAFERLARRAAAGTDPSDAGPSRYAASVAGFEATEEWPRDEHFVVHTDREGWRDELRETAARLVRSPSYSTPG